MEIPRNLVLKIVAAILLIFVVALGIDLYNQSLTKTYRTTFPYPEKIQAMVKDTHIITTTVKYAIDQEDKTTTIDATTMYLGNGYFLALTHATKHPGIIQIAMGPFTSSQAVNVKEHAFKIDNKYNVVLVGRCADISLFKSSEYAKPETAYKFAKRDMIATGDKVILIGNSFMRGLNLKDGMVSRLHTTLKIFRFAPVFYISAPSNPGDSGGAVLAFTGSDYYVVGILCAGLRGGDGMGAAFEKDFVIAALENIAPGVDFLK